MWCIEVSSCLSNGRPRLLPRSDVLVPSRVRVKFSNTVRIVHKSGHWSNNLLFHHSEMRNYLLPSGIRGSLREWAIYFGSIKLHEFSEPWFVYLNWVHESPLFCTFIEHEKYVNRIWWDSTSAFHNFWTFSLSVSVAFFRSRYIKMTFNGLDWLFSQ